MLPMNRLLSIFTFTRRVIWLLVFSLVSGSAGNPGHAAKKNLEF
jgi:hypothetical protein